LINGSGSSGGRLFSTRETKSTVFPAPFSLQTRGQPAVFSAAGQMGKQRNSGVGAGLEVEMVRGRGAAARTVVKDQHVGPQGPGEGKHVGDPTFEALGGVLARGDGEMAPQDRVGIRQNHQIAKGDASFLRGNIFGTQKTGAPGYGCRIDFGVGGLAAARIGLHHNLGMALRNDPGLHARERRLPFSKQRPVLTLVVE
jgi:hypothetical protein